MYKLKITPPASKPNNVLHLDNNVCIPMDPDNTDYQEYLVWLSEGNSPEPADE